MNRVYQMSLFLRSFNKLPSSVAQRALISRRKLLTLSHGSWCQIYTSSAALKDFKPSTEEERKDRILTIPINLCVSRWRNENIIKINCSILNCFSPLLPYAHNWWQLFMACGLPVQRAATKKYYANFDHSNQALMRIKIASWIQLKVKTFL